MSEKQPQLNVVLLLAGAMVILTGISGVMHGKMSNRWGASADLQSAGDAIGELPDQFGGWTMEEEKAVPNLVIETIQASGSAQRVYADDRGYRVEMVLLAGPPGPIAVHKPEICYSSQNTQMLEEESVTVGGSNEHSFRMIKFKPESLSATPFRVFYGFSEDGVNWVASENPRVEFGDADYLYKLQMVSDALVPTDGDDSAQAFLSAFAQAFGGIAKRK